MKEVKIERTCPICGHKYTDYPALSRLDNVTLICSECGIRQALDSIGVNDSDDQDHIIELARRNKA